MQLIPTATDAIEFILLSWDSLSHFLSNNNHFLSPSFLSLVHPSHLFLFVSSFSLPLYLSAHHLSLPLYLSAHYFSLPPLSIFIYRLPPSLIPLSLSTYSSSLFSPLKLYVLSISLLSLPFSIHYNSPATTFLYPPIFLFIPHGLCQTSVTTPPPPDHLRPPFSPPPQQSVPSPSYFAQICEFKTREKSFLPYVCNDFL